MSDGTSHDGLPTVDGGTAPVVEALRTIVCDVLRIPPGSVTPQSRLAELAHVESIKLLRIAGRIERRFGIELDDGTVVRDGTLLDIAEEIRAAAEAGPR